ncbi:MAG: glycosyltransferase family 4 protein [Pseudomonadota bacterium]|nr:glycosyltransferase family 4 protein [Pseudomonadota bacterium]
MQTGKARGLHGALGREGVQALSPSTVDGNLSVVHLLSGLEIGGKERAALRLAGRGLADGGRHALWLFDTPFRSNELDFEPGDVPTRFLPRGSGLDLGFIRALAHGVAADGVGTIHAHNDTALCYGAFACALLGRRRAPRLVGTFHTWPGHATPAARLLTRWAGGRAVAVAAVSDELRHRLLTSGWLRHCRTVWNGIDLGLFRSDGTNGGWHRRLGVAPGTPLIVHVARFDPIKRHTDLIEAARLVHAAYPDAVFVLAGQGPLFAPVQDLARDLPWVRFAANVPDVAPLLRAASIFVLPSAHEAAPLALLEAMACGRACVCTAVGGVPAMLADYDAAGPCGLLVPPGEPPVLAAAIGRLLGDTAMREQLGTRARAAAVARFSFEREWQTYCRLYAGEPPP